MDMPPIIDPTRGQTRTRSKEQTRHDLHGGDPGVFGFDCPIVVQIEGFAVTRLDYNPRLLWSA